MSRLRNLSYNLLALVSVVFSVEIGYRLILLLDHPAYFRDKVGSSFSTMNQTQWRYDSEYGYDYVTNAMISAVNIKKGQIVGCSEYLSANEQGNVGPLVPDYDAAEVRIAVFGDSFSATMKGSPWTQFLEKKLESDLGKKVRVMNMARDGYSVSQMIALARGKVAELRPSLIVIAFVDGAVGRARTWRSAIGAGDDIRLYASVENTPSPDPAKAADLAIAVPSATHSWCEAEMKKSPEEQRVDPVMQTIIAKHQQIEIKNRRPKADFFDLRSSYVYDLLRYNDPFFSQWRNLPPSAVPKVNYDDYSADPKFVSDLAALTESGVPYVLVHLAAGSTINKGLEYEADVRTRRLLESLARLSGQKIYNTLDFIPILQEDALKMCGSKDDCHPSEFGNEVYAEVVKRVILKSGLL